MYCKNCGNEVAEGSKFCLHCGQPMAAPQEAVDNAENAVENTVTEIKEETENAVQEIAEEAEATVENTEAAAVEQTETAAAAATAVFVPDSDERAKLEKAEQDAKKKEQEAAEALAQAQARAEEARELARQAAVAKTKLEASDSINAANALIAGAAQIGEQYTAALNDAGAAYEKAKDAQEEAQKLGVYDLPELNVPSDLRAPSANAPVYEQTPPPVYAPVEEKAADQAGETGEKAKYITPWGYFFLTLLYCIPVIGWIFLIVHSFGKKNVNRKNFALSIWVKLLVCLIIACIVVIVVMIFKDTDIGVKIKDYVKAIYDSVKGATETYFGSGAAA